MRTIAVIPARYRSKRLPGKPLAEIHGKTMIQRVYERVTRANRLDEILVATDDERIASVVSGFGGKAVMTSPSHASGSDRVAEAVRDLNFDLVVNVQGDLPLLPSADIDAAVGLAEKTPGAIATLRHPISDRATLTNPNVVKVTSDLRGFALYFSRSPIPWPPPPGAEDSPLPPGVYFKHIGLYVYPKERLLSLSALPPTTLELQEGLEQLRAMEHGVPIRLEESEEESVTVDTEADLERARELVQEREALQTAGPGRAPSSPSGAVSCRAARSAKRRAAGVRSPRH
ncbi:MAG TPA: 3-deoxy-manno-octulosonate cytidylyltransferase [Vicinamibacteria bacterium]